MDFENEPKNGRRSGNLSRRKQFATVLMSQNSVNVRSDVGGYCTIYYLYGLGICSIFTRRCHGSPYSTVVEVSMGVRR